MRVADICTRRVMHATPSMTIVEAAELMRRYQVGALVVVVSTGSPRPIGMLTDRDIAINAVACRKDLARTRVDEIMTRSIVTCRADARMSEVIDIMRSRGVRRVPVIGDDGLLAGMVTTDDVAGGLAKQLVALSRAVVYPPAFDGESEE